MRLVPGEVLPKITTSSYNTGIAALLNYCCCSVTQSCPNLCDPMDYSTPAFFVLHHHLEFAQTHIHRVSDATQSSHLLLSPSPPASCHFQRLVVKTFPSIKVFSNESALHIRWPEYWSLSFSICPSSEYPGLISLGLTDLISLLSKGLSGIFSSTSSKASILWCSAFFIVQFSHMYVTSEKTHSFDYTDLCKKSNVSAL